MANVHFEPGEQYLTEKYYDSSMPGGAMYYALQDLDMFSKEGVHPVIAQNRLAAAEWALNGRGQPAQKAQYYKIHEFNKTLFGTHDGGRVGKPYYGPQAPVITTSLRPRGAKPLGPANDN